MPLPPSPQDSLPIGHPPSSRAWSLQRRSGLPGFLSVDAGERPGVGSARGPRRRRWLRCQGAPWEPAPGEAWKGGAWDSTSLSRADRKISELKQPVVRSLPLTRHPAHCFPFARVAGGRRGTPGFWSLAARQACGLRPLGPLGRPRLSGGRRERVGPSGCSGPSASSSAMGSRSSHAAVIPDGDSIRRETGCECARAGGCGGDGANPGVWG